MEPVLIVYATREGHTRHIAEYLGEALSARHRSFDLVDAAHLPGKYEPEMVKFVKRNLAKLQEIPTVFVSGSLAEKTVEDESASPAKRGEAQTHVAKTIDDLLGETGWRPSHIAPVAGAPLYSRYNFVTRFIMKRISAKAGGPVDTSRDYEFTDWTKLDHVVEELLQNLL